jgi:UrcA family protein
MNTVRIVKSTFFLLAAAALACGNASFAGSDDGPPQRIVRYDDLNLANPAGLETLYRRLLTASKAVCAPQISVPQTLKSRQRVCARETLADAVARIDNPNLTVASSR